MPVTFRLQSNNDGRPDMAGMIVFISCLILFVSDTEEE